MVLPPISYGLNLHHIDFPGTIHIEPEVFIAFCLNITKSVAYHGFQKILIVNGHGSNTPLIDLVARKTVLETQSLCFATVELLRFGIEAFKRIRESAVMAHADEFETSLYLHLRRERVRMDKAVAGQRPHGQVREQRQHVDYFRAFQRLLGPLDQDRRPRRPDQGHRGEGQDHLGRHAVSGLVELVDELRAWPIAPRSDQHQGPVQSQIRW